MLISFGGEKCHSQNDESLAKKSQLSDILIELIKLGFGANRDLLKIKDLNLIKNLKSEKDIFKLFLNNND